MSHVAEIYNQLLAYESKNSTIPYPIHKKLQLKSEKSIYHWIANRIQLESNQKILDAGCGTGYGLFYLQTLKPISGLGISISPKEIAFATDYLKTQNQSDLTFALKSYDEPFDQTYDIILAIESLKHSSNISVTMKNIWSSLKPGGLLIIADDFKIKQWSGFKKLQELWSLPSFLHLEQLNKLLPKAKIKIEDLSHLVPVRSKVSLQIGISAISHYRRIFQPKNQNIMTYLGGLILEMGYARKRVSYNIIFAKKGH